MWKSTAQQPYSRHFHVLTLSCQKTMLYQIWGPGSPWLLEYLGHSEEERISAPETYSSTVNGSLIQDPNHIELCYLSLHLGCAVRCFRKQKRTYVTMQGNWEQKTEFCSWWPLASQFRQLANPLFPHLISKSHRI